jgi:hypothetical protein
VPRRLRLTSFDLSGSASAFRDRDNSCGLVAFDVDPGQPGGNTSMAATYYAVNEPFGEVKPVDKFTLTWPRTDR